MALVNNQMALNTVYNTFLTTYALKTDTKYDAHKKSELKNVYNSILKQNKEAPLYLYKSKKETQEFAVGLKESARQLKNTISSLSSQDATSFLDKKVAYSTNPDSINAKYIAETNIEDEGTTFQIEVANLASSQINLGKFLAPETISLPPDTYSFDIQVKDNDFEFQFGINESDQNKLIQTKLSNLINRSNIGITSSVVEDAAGNSSLRLESVSTGVSDSQSLSFTVSENKTSKKTGVVEYMGLNEVTSPATNATFTLNGTTHNSASNSFTVDKKFEITLNNITGDQSPITIGLKPDTESMADNIQQLVDGYNGFIQNVSNYHDSSLNSDRLLSEMTCLCNSYRNELDSIGLSFDQDGKISMDRTLLSQSLTEDEAKENLSIIGGFSSSVVNKINQVSLDPMNYVKKTVVAYKNPGKSLVTPYIASVYSGMMFNYYC